MSWQLASFGLVLGALAACWLWFERTRPSSRMVAVVAVLGALAALGRDAFAALPDVKPTTTIALISGYVLGGAPGFAVGAVGALASNFALGQGPWTPWQMIGWGLVGVAGALLGVLSRRRLGRLPLALCCALAAAGFNLVMNFYSWSLSGSHTGAQYVFILGQALPFDVTHVLASFAFGLAFGPALVRILGRLQDRLEVEWEPAAAAPGVLLAVIALGAAGAGTLGPAHASAATAKRAAYGREVSFLLRAQNPDGGFGGAAGQRSSELYTAWSAMGLAAAGRDAGARTSAGHSLVDSLAAGAAGIRIPGDIERTMLALHAAGAPVTTLAGRSLLTELLRARGRDGSFSHLVNITSFAVFALRAAGRSAGDPAVRAAGRWIERQQNSDGGFDFATRGGASDTDDTAAALQALSASGAGASAAARRATAFLVAHQNPDGGYPLSLGGESNAQSTAWAIQGLVAGGRQVDRVRRGGSRTPVEYLKSLVAPDGSVRYSRTSAQTPVWVTAQALTALTRKPLPIAPPARRASVAPAVAETAPGPPARRRHRTAVRALAAPAAAASAQLLARQARLVATLAH